MMKAMKVRQRYFTCNPLRHEKPERISACFIPKIPPQRPDPAIYSQEEQFAQGLASTWDNPDIITNKWPPWSLSHEVKTTVRNLSPDTNAVNVVVNLFTSAFGIGMSRTLLSTQIVDISYQGEVTLIFPLSQAILEGAQSIGTHVIIEHPYDKVPINNRGSQTVDMIVTGDSGRNIEVFFPVLNGSGAMRQINLSVLANDVNAVVSPTAHQFAPWEQIQARLNFQVPNTLHATGDDILKYVTVVGRGSSGELIDGLTYIIRIND